MKKLEVEIKVPEYVDIVIVGPCGVGKSIIANRIAGILRDEFGASVVTDGEIDNDCVGREGHEPADWQKKMVKETVWRLHEKLGPKK